MNEDSWLTGALFIRKKTRLVIRIRRTPGKRYAPFKIKESIAGHFSKSLTRVQNEKVFFLVRERFIPRPIAYLILWPLISLNYWQRKKGLAPDKWFYPDALALHWGYAKT